MLVYCDGSSKTTLETGMTGRFAIVFIKDETIVKEYQSPVIANATNSDMEVKALLEVLKMIETLPKQKFMIFSDSEYVVKSFNLWMDKWARDNWKKDLKQKDWK